MARKAAKLMDGNATSAAVSELNGVKISDETKRSHSKRDVSVVEPMEVWCGNPRDMREEDYAFFGFQR